MRHSSFDSDDLSADTVDQLIGVGASHVDARELLSDCVFSPDKGNLLLLVNDLRTPVCACSGGPVSLPRLLGLGGGSVEELFTDKTFADVITGYPMTGVRNRLLRQLGHILSAADFSDSVRAFGCALHELTNPTANDNNGLRAIISG